MSMDLNENSLKEADFLSNNPERHNSDSSVEFLMVFLIKKNLLKLYFFFIRQLKKVRK